MTGSPSARNFAVTSMPASTTPVMMIISIAAGCAILELFGLVIELISGILSYLNINFEYYSSTLLGARLTIRLIRINVKYDDNAINKEWRLLAAWNR